MSERPLAGEPVEAPAETPDHAATSDDAPMAHTGGKVPLHPAAVVIWRTVGIIWTVILGVIALTICAVAGSGIAVVIATVATAALLVLAWVMPARRHRWWRYAIGHDALEIDRGVWTRMSSSVPFHRIQQIDVSQGPLQRRLGVVTLQLRTAAAASDGVVPHLDADHAAALRTGLLRVAAQSVVDDGH